MEWFSSTPERHLHWLTVGAPLHRTKHTSNGKKKGEGNTKCGNKYLAWAFVEAAHFAARHYDAPQRFLQRKSCQRPYVVAIKALAHKLARASYYVMKDNVEFDERRLFS